MPNVFDNINSAAMAAYVTRPEKALPPYLGQGLFPSQKRNNISLEWLYKETGLPIILEPSAFDAKPTLRDRDGYTDVKTKMPFFREAMELTEQQRQDLLDFMELTNNPRVKDIIMDIFDDATNLVNGAMVVPEVMRMRLLSEAKFTFESKDENGRLVKYDYNYDPEGKWKKQNTITLNGNARWSDLENSNPINDLNNLRKKALNDGTISKYAIMTGDTFNLILNNKNVRNLFAINGVVPAFISDDAVIKMVESQAKITIVTYDKVYKNGSKVEKFYPDNYVTLIPEGTLGTTWYGRTPEEADLAAGQVPGASVTVVNTGVAILTLRKALPVNITTSVSQIVLPSYENMMSVYTLKAA